MSFANIPVMGSAQDLRRQLRYSTSRRTKSGRGPYYNQVSNQVDLKSSHRPITAPGRFNNPDAINNKTKTININPASSSFPNTASINLPTATHLASHMSVTSSRAPVHYRSASGSRPYIPPPSSRRNYQTGEADRASRHSNHRDYSTVPRSSSVARSTASNRLTNRDYQGRTNASTGSTRPGYRPVSPYRSLTLPDEPEINQVFPNSDPNQVTDINVPIPSGYVSSRISTSKARPSAGTGIRTRTRTPSVTAPLGSASGYRRPTSQAAASTTSRNVPPQRQSGPQHHYQNSQPRSSSHTSRIPFIPPNGVPPVAAARPLTRSPSRPRSPSRNAHIQPSAHVDTSPSSATIDSNAGPRVREGQVLSGLTSRTEPESRNLSRARGRSPSLHPVYHASQTRNNSTSRARGMDHHPHPSISGPSVMPVPEPIPVPTPITHVATIPRESKSRQAIPFPNVGRVRMRQFGNYIPYPKKFRQNRPQAHVETQAQDARFGQEHYPTRPIGDDKSHDLLANGSTVEIPRPHDRSSPAAITRSPSRHPNQRSRSASRQSRHSKRSQQSRHTLTNRSVHHHDTRAPVELRIKGDQGIKNTRQNKVFKWKWPAAGFGMGKLLNPNSSVRLREPVVSDDITPNFQVVQDSHKRTRTKSNSSANWQFPQIKNLMVFKTPVRELPKHSELPPRPTLHPLLRVPTLFRPARLNWDVRNQALPVMSNADTAAMQKLLKEPATSPPTTHMVLLVRSPAPKRLRVKSSHLNPKFWEVDVFSSPASRNHPHPYIKCMDVLRAFGKMLRAPADTSEFDSLDIMHQRLAVRAFEMRAAGIFGRQGNDLADLEHEKAREMRKGYRKVDLLVNQTRWDGLKSTGSRSNEWIVELGRVPFNPF